MSGLGQSRLAHCVNVAAAAGGIALWHSTLKGSHPVYAQACNPSPSVCTRRPCPPKKAPEPEEPCPICPICPAPPNCEPCIPCDEKPDCGEPQLELRQAHVFFKHSFTTPMQSRPRIKQPTYDPELVIREHQWTLFPYDKLDACTGRPVDYSCYQKRMDATTLPGGVYPGALTGYGKDEMYLFGQKLRNQYVHALDLKPFDPRNVNMLSTNVRRTVESARCVLAGMYSSGCLNRYACTDGPVPIYVTSPLYNILIPDTFNCKLLQDVKHSAFVHHEFIPAIRDAKAEVQDFLAEKHQELLDSAQEVQDKLSRICELREQTPGVERSRSMRVNKFRQLYLHDEEVTPVLLKRSEAFEKIPCLWADAFCRAPSLARGITKDDIKGLAYLKRMEVEEFDGMFQRGYRYTFYFRPNPYFHNEVLHKEVYLQPGCGVKPSKETEILWKKCGSLLPERACSQDGLRSPSQCLVDSKDCDESSRCFTSKHCPGMIDRLGEPEEEEEPEKESSGSSEGDANASPEKDPCSEFDEEGNPIPKETGESPPKPKPKKVAYKECPKKFCTVKPPPPPPLPTFFQWFVYPTREECDLFGQAIREDIWPDPLSLLENEAKCQCIPEKPFDFLVARSDFRARYATGYRIPYWLRKFCANIEQNAAKILHYSVRGQTVKERPLVTRLAAGPLLDTVFGRVTRHIECGDAPKLCLYSCHDSTMVALLEALDISQPRWPPYGANLRLELYEDVNTGNHYVRVFYNDCEKVIRCQESHLARWCKVQDAMRTYTIKEDDYARQCASDCLKTLNPCLLRHYEQEKTEQCSPPCYDVE